MASKADRERLKQMATAAKLAKTQPTTKTPLDQEKISRILGSTYETLTEPAKPDPQPQQQKKKPKLGNRDKKMASKGRLPLGSSFDLRWNGAEWHGVLTVPGFAPFVSSNNGVFHLLTILDDRFRAKAAESQELSQPSPVTTNTN